MRLRFQLLSMLLVVAALAACSDPNGGPPDAEQGPPDCGVPTDTAAVTVSLAGALGGLDSASAVPCSTQPTHVVLRLSYPDGSFYVRRVASSELSVGSSEVTLYAPPGNDVMLYAVAIHHDPSALAGFRPDRGGAQVNLFLSGFRSELGSLDYGERETIEVDLSALEPAGFTWLEEGEQPFDGTDGLDLRVSVPWMQDGANTYDEQGPQVFNENGYVRIDGEWRPWLSTSGWGSPDVTLHLSSASGTLSGPTDVHVGPAYVSGVNFGFQESTRFYLASMTCAPSQAVVTASF